MLKSAVCVFLLVFLTSCATVHQNFTRDDLLVYTAEYNETPIRRHLPFFIIENSLEEHNRIGTPSAKKGENSINRIFINNKIPTIYAETRRFNSEKDSYTNLIYRIHFEKIPFSLFPFYLGSGKNVGLIVVVTLNRKSVPVLYTTVHTCGCYLAFIPTSYMPQDAYPDNWNIKRQNVYGEVLPGLLNFKDTLLSETITAIEIRNNTHRVKDIYRTSRDSFINYKTAVAEVQPLGLLQYISQGSEGSTSFFEESGKSAGYVKGSYKPWEMFLMSWWALDWRVGQDKKLGRDNEDGPKFYTSLKPWARSDSDMRLFFTFLKYWGWKL